MKKAILATTSLPMLVANAIEEIEDYHIGLFANIRAELKVVIAESLAVHVVSNIHEPIGDDAVERVKYNPRHPRNNNGGHITRGGNCKSWGKK